MRYCGVVQCCCWSVLMFFVMACEECTSGFGGCYFQPIEIEPVFELCDVGLHLCGACVCISVN